MDLVTRIDSSVEDTWLLLHDSRIPLSYTNHRHHIQIKIRSSRNDTAAERNPGIIEHIMWTWSFGWHGDVIICKYCSHNWHFGIESTGLLARGQLCGALIYYLLFAWTMCKNNRRVAGDVGRSCDVIIMEGKGSLRNTDNILRPRPNGRLSQTTFSDVTVWLRETSVVVKCIDLQTYRHQPQVFQLSRLFYRSKMWRSYQLHMELCSDILRPK